MLEKVKQKRSDLLKNIKNLTMSEVRELSAFRETEKKFFPISSSQLLKNALERKAYGKKNDEYASSIVCEPISERWKKNFSHEWWASVNIKKSSEDKCYLELFDRLLSFSGEEVCIPFIESDMSDILEYGQFWFGINAKRMRGQASRCHSNTADLWEENKDNTLICTGYALTKDGMWRPHSWLMWLKPNSNMIVETTTPRVAYFGVCFNYAKSEKFSEDTW